MIEKNSERLGETALEGLKVLEYGQFVAVPYCTKLLADLGAEVIKIEKPDIGDEARHRGPFPEDVPHPERSGLFLYLNTNKLGITLNLRTSTGKKIFEKLVREADILVEGNPVGAMKEMGLDFESLRSANPPLVMTSITPFGQTGPHSEYKSYYLNTFHGGGEGYTLPGGVSWLLYADRPPVKAGGFIGEFNCGVAAASATLAAIYNRDATGAGQYIDISKQEVLLTLMRPDLTKYNFGFVESRATRSVPVGGFVQCRDGFILLVPLFKHMWDGLIEFMGNPQWAKDDRFKHERIVMAGWQSAAPVSEDILQDRQKAQQYVEEWAISRTREEIVTGLQAKGCIATKVCNAEDLLNSEQIQSRQFFTEVEHPHAGRFKYAGPPYKFSETPWRVEKPAPSLGQHNEEIYCRRLGYSKDDLVQLRRTGII